MTARTIKVLQQDIPNIGTQFQAWFHGDTAEEALAACRAWTWKKMKDQPSFIRQPPEVAKLTNFDDEVEQYRASVRCLITERLETISIGGLVEKPAA